ncbi:hypothetical protein PBOI14_61650 [Pseudomonas sp. Boi14]|nr:hypothetical protein PBOI14_61650 [Pseudomonas sp. Boi14]
MLFNSNQMQAGRLIVGLLEGRSPVVRHFSREGGVSEVRLLPVKFSKAYGDYQSCMAKLLPMNYEQVKQAEIGFPGGGIDLDARAKAKLQVMVDFIKADPTVNHVELDGHSDNSGNRLTNRDLSRRRALAVMEFFKANGLAENQIVVRFHGERYPLAPTPMRPTGRRTGGSMCIWSGSLLSKSRPQRLRRLPDPAQRRLPDTAVVVARST